MILKKTTRCNQTVYRIICPEYRALVFSTNNQDADVKSNTQARRNCPARHLCAMNKDFIKTVTRHI